MDIELSDNMYLLVVVLLVSIAVFVLFCCMRQNILGFNFGTKEGLSVTPPGHMRRKGKCFEGKLKTCPNLKLDTPCKKFYRDNFLIELSDRCKDIIYPDELKQIISHSHVEGPPQLQHPPPPAPTPSPAPAPKLAPEPVPEPIPELVPEIIPELVPELAPELAPEEPPVEEPKDLPPELPINKDIFIKHKSKDGLVRYVSVYDIKLCNPQKKVEYDCANTVGILTKFKNPSLCTFILKKVPETANKYILMSKYVKKNSIPMRLNYGLFITVDSHYTCFEPQNKDIDFIFEKVPGGILIKFQRLIDDNLKEYFITVCGEKNDTCLINNSPYKRLCVTGIRSEASVFFLSSS